MNVLDGIEKILYENVIEVTFKDEESAVSDLDFILREYPSLSSRLEKFKEGQAMFVVTENWKDKLSPIVEKLEAKIEFRGRNYGNS